MSALRIVLVCAVAASLAACGPHPPKKGAAAPPPPPPTAIVESGWLDADGADGPGVVFHDDTAGPGFALRCLRTSKVLKVTAPNPLPDPPQAAEKAQLVLGSETFEAPVAQVPAATAPQLTMETAVTPQLLIALGDAKTARLTFRDGASETGVDEESRIIGFAQRCSRVTGVEPAL